MRYADYYDCDICNGNAVGMSLFVQGCPLHCDGCFNPETWDFAGGKEWNKETKYNFIKLAGRDYISRISILGGEPLCDENVKEVLCLVMNLSMSYPQKQIWIDSGYTWEKIFEDESYFNTVRQNVLSFADVLVDGQFECDKKDLSLPFRGSGNQRIIDIQESIKNNRIVLCKKYEENEQ